MFFSPRFPLVSKPRTITRELYNKILITGNVVTGILTSLTIITPIMKRKQSVAQLNGKNDILRNIIIGNLQALRDNNFFSTVHEGFSGYSGEK